MATLKDTAQIAGITQGTVPRILNQDPTLCATDGTRGRVMRIMESLGYKKSTLWTVSSAPTGQERRISIVQMLDMEELWEDIYYLALKNILDEGYFLRRWITAPLYQGKRRRFVRRNQAPLDDLFIVGCFTQKEMAGFHECTDDIVFLDLGPEPMWHYGILSNYHLAVQLALKRPRINNHQLTTYLGGVDTFGDHRGLTMGPRFYYYRASQANRDSYNPSLVLDCKMDAKSGYVAMRSFLETYDRPPETMFIASDSIALGAMMALREQGLWMPEGISIIAFNNTVLLKYSDPPPTSIELFMRENVRAATFCM